MVLGLLGWLAILVVLGAVAVVAAGVVFAVALARKSKTDYDAGNLTVPGRSGAVPDAWGGSHDPEAVLHRRLVAAMDALRANQAFDDDGGLLDLRVELEHQALTLDQRLVAIAPLAVARKVEPLAAAEADVDRIEAAVADLAVRSAADARPSLDAATDRLTERTALIGDAMAELDASGAAPATPLAPIAAPAPLAAQATSAGAAPSPAEAAPVRPATPAPPVPPSEPDTSATPAAPVPPSSRPAPPVPPGDEPPGV